MPNYVKNILEVQGANADGILDSLRGQDNDEEDMDFNKIISMPDELEGTTSPSRSSTERLVTTLYKDDESFKEFEARVVEHLIGSKDVLDKPLKETWNAYKKNGALNWYDWNITHWGTKWNACEPERIDSDTVVFDTAWSTPVKAIEELSRQYPDNTFSVRYADEDIGSNCGRYAFQAGDMVEEWYPTDDEAVQYAKEMWGYEDEDED